MSSKSGFNSKKKNYNKIYDLFSCDDAAVAILNSKTRKVLADRRSADHEGWQRLGGVLPFQSARHVSLTIGLDCSQVSWSENWLPAINFTKILNFPSRDEQ